MFVTQNYFIRVNYNDRPDKQDGTYQFPFDNIQKAINVLPQRGIVKPSIYLIDNDIFVHGEVYIADKKVSIQGGYLLQLPNQRFDEEIRQSTNPLFSISTGTLNLKNIYFKTISKNTQLIAVTGNGVLSLDTISVEQEYEPFIYQRSKSLISTFAATVTIKRSSFRDISLLNEPLFNLGLSYWVISRSCSFENIQVRGINGSIISEIMFGAATYLRIENTIISECKTIADSARGAAINFGIERGKDNFYFKNIIFPKASIAQDTTGTQNEKWDNVIFIRADNLTERLPAPYKIHFADDIGSGWKYAGSDDTTEEIPLYYLWNEVQSNRIHQNKQFTANEDHNYILNNSKLSKQVIGIMISGTHSNEYQNDILLPDIEENYYVDVPENEVDAPDGTGTEIDPYKNVNLAVNNIPVHGIVQVKIHIVTNRPFTHKSVEIRNKTAIIIGRRVENPNVQIYMDYPEETQAMFKLDQGYLELSNLILAGVNTANSIIRSISSGTLAINDCEIKGSATSIFDVSAIITTSGTTTINNCEFNSFEVSKSLFSIGQSQITITNSNFDSIIGNINGLIISEDNLNSNAFITLKNLSFTNLQSTTPNKNGRGSVIFLNIIQNETPFQFNDTQFSNCTIDNRDSYIYIKTDNLKTRFPNADKLPFADNINTGWEFSGEDIVNTQGREIPLHYLWNPYKNDKVYVGNDGVDELWCGRSDWPCKTLDVGYTRFNNSELNTFVIVGSVQLNEQIDIARSLEFESSDINIRALINVSGNAQFNALEGGLSFTIRNIDVFIDSTLQQSLIVASGQQRDVIVENVIFERGQLSPSQPIQILDKLIRVDNIQSLTIQDVTFEDFQLTFETPHGLCIYAVNVPYILINRCIFRNLQSANLGLALAAVYNQQFTQTANINIYYTQFYNLVQQSPNGGGAIYYEGSQNYLHLDVCYFEGGNSTNANDIYFNGVIPQYINSTNIVRSFSNSNSFKIGGSNIDIVSNTTIQALLGLIYHTVIVNGSNPSASDSNYNGPYKTIYGSIVLTPLIYEMIPRTIQIVEYTLEGAYNEDEILEINNKLLTFERYPSSTTVRINTAVGQQFDKLVSVTN
ncbi:MAG: hypothetical protein EZS28_030360, partial [Streblomastix strix]